MPKERKMEFKKKNEKWGETERTPTMYCLSEGEISPQLIHMAFTFFVGYREGPSTLPRSG
jgi:hypothetical protein